MIDQVLLKILYNELNDFYKVIEYLTKDYETFNNGSKKLSDPP